MNISTRKRQKGQETANSNMENGQLLDIPSNSQSNLTGDGKNIVLLLFLYTLQGIPLGLSAAIPMILQNRASYKQQAEFSFVTWPFSLKLLWAPLVDSLYSHRFGRRKTWLIPVQYLLGAFMLLLSRHVDQWLGSDDTDPNIGILTLLFFILNFLAATQDIAVDGWALTMLKKRNVGHASTCNSVGQTAGYFFSYVLFLALESPSFCNAYLRSTPQDQGIVTLPGFLQLWGWVFIVTTTLVAILKKEVEPHDADHETVPERNLQSAYKPLKDILQLKSIQTLVLVLFTCKMGFSSTDSVMGLKLVEAGVPKEKLAMMAIPMIPLQLMLPVFLARYTTDMQGYLQTSALPVETPASKSTFNNYDIYVPNYNSIGPFLLQNLQEIERMNFTSLDVLKPEYTYRIAELTQHYLDQSNITSNFYEGTISNVAVMDLNDNYVSLIMGDSKYFGAGEMTSAGYVSDSDNHDEGKISSRIPLIVTDGSMICGRRMVLGASDLTLATQLITSLLIANDNLVDAVEAPRFHLLGNGSIGIESKVALAVVSALHYLYSHLKVIHRDVKPSNILINKKGEVKMCDFGISGHLVDSVAKTIDAGCKPYMAPERIDPQGNPSKYDIRSDVWSLGISLIELATGKFPYPIWGTPFEQLKQVVADEPPRLPPGQFSAEFEDLIEKCLQKSYTQRWNYAQLLQHPFLVRHRDMDTDISEFITQILELPDNP